MLELNKYITSQLFVPIIKKIKTILHRNTGVKIIQEIYREERESYKLDLSTETS
jgi:hypothetical protein